MHPASLPQRLWAAFFDALILTSWVVLAAIVTPWPELLPGQARAAIWFGPILLLEPFSIRFFGRTAGQNLLGLRVASTSVRTPGFLRLFGRHLSKGLFLGAGPFYTLFSPRGQALHDHLFGTAVLTQSSRQTQSTAHLRFPLRAFLVSFTFSVAAGLAAASLTFVILAVGVAAAGRALPEGPTADALLSLPVSIAFLWAQLRVLHRGARGRLPGVGGVATVGEPAA